MRFQLSGAWPVGRWLLPAGTLLEADARGEFFWNGFQLPKPMPVEAVCLDQRAYDEHLRPYPYHRILTAGEIVRHGDPKKAQ